MWKFEAHTKLSVFLLRRTDWEHMSWKIKYFTPGINNQSERANVRENDANEPSRRGRKAYRSWWVVIVWLWQYEKKAQNDFIFTQWNGRKMLPNQPRRMSENKNLCGDALSSHFRIFSIFQLSLSGVCLQEAIRLPDSITSRTRWLFSHFFISSTLCRSVFWLWELSSLVLIKVDNGMEVDGRRSWGRKKGPKSPLDDREEFEMIMRRRRNGKKQIGRFFHFHFLLLHNFSSPPHTLFPHFSTFCDYKNFSSPSCSECILVISIWQ